MARISFCGREAFLLTKRKIFGKDVSILSEEYLGFFPQNIAIKIDFLEDLLL